MPQNVPSFEFSDDAKRVRQAIYEHWCAHGRAPNLRGVRETTGLARERLVEVYRELDLGLILTLDQRTNQLAILKCQPFSSYPSQVEVHLDGSLPLLGRLRHGVDRHLPDAAIRGPRAPSRVLLRLLPGAHLARRA